MEEENKVNSFLTQDKIPKVCRVLERVFYVLFVSRIFDGFSRTLSTKAITNRTCKHILSPSEDLETAPAYGKAIRETVEVCCEFTQIEQVKV